MAARITRIELLLDWLDDNDPPIEGVCVELWELRTTDHAIVKIEHSHDFYPCVRPLRYQLRYSYTDVWRCLGQAIGKSETIQSFSLHYMRNEFDALEPLPSSLLPSITALQSGLRENKSIQSFAFSQSHVIAGTNLPMFDFDYFLKNNEMLNDIHLGINEDLTWDQACMIEAAIKEKTMKQIKLHSFTDNQFFRKILMSCLRSVEGVIVSCDTIQQCEAIAEFISHPEIATTSLAVTASELMSESKIELLKAALIQNKTLFKLNIVDISVVRHYPLTYTPDWGSILCDASSIENIYASNHVMQKIWGYGVELSVKDLACLNMNEQLSPEQAAREKIFWYYFVGNFSIEPFVDMPASVVVEVMGMIKMESEGEFDPNAFFRLLKCRPDLCSFARKASSNVPFRMKHDDTSK